MAQLTARSADAGAVLAVDFTDDMTVIPRNAQIIVKRVPAVAGRRPAYLQQQGGGGGGGAGRSIPASTFAATRPPFRASAPVSLASAPAGGAGSDEEARIRAMMMATSSHWEQNQQAMPLQQQGPRKLFRPANFAPRGMLSAPPDTYVCYRCGQKGMATSPLLRQHPTHFSSSPGHFIQSCPTNTDPNYDKTRIRKTTGIPRSFLKPAAGQPDSASSYLVTPEGDLVVAAPNDREWDRIAKIRSLAETAASIPLEEIPSGLVCAMGGHILSDAVRMPCCGALFCDECVRNLFEDAVSLTAGDATITCPKCRRERILQEGIVPDVDARNRVQSLLESRSQFKVPDEANHPEEDGTTPAGPTPPTTGSGKRPGEGPPLPPFPFGFPPFPFMFPPPPPGMFPPPPPPLDGAAAGRRDYQRPARPRSPSPPRRQQERRVGGEPLLSQQQSRTRRRSRSRSP